MFNNKTKTFLLLTLIFVTLLGVSAATAATIDNNATDTTSNAQEAIIQTVDTAVSDNSIPTTTVSNKEINKNTQTDVKTEGEGTFDDLYNDIKDTSEVTLTKDYKHVSGDYGLISINEDKTIDGAGHTINGGDINIFTITQTATLTLKNMEITAEGNQGTNLLIVNGNLFCENVTFDMEKVTSSYSSIIYYNTNFANVTCADCTFKNFISTKAAIEGYRYGNLTVDNCIFQNLTTNNGAIKKQSGLASGMPITSVKNSRFIDNNASYGVIYINNMNNVLYVDNCYFINNVGTSYGTIYNPCKNSTIRNSQFINNKNTGSTDDSKGIIKINSNSAVYYAENNTMDDPDAVGAEIYVQAGKIDSPLITGQDVNADPNQEVTIKYNFTDDNGNSILLKGVTYTFKVNGETYTADYNNGVISKTITAPSQEDYYDVEIVPSSTSLYINPIINNALIKVGNPIGKVIITDATYNQFFDADGNIIEGTISEGSIAKFEGTFTNRNFNINIPLTVDSGRNPAVFDNCTFTVTNDVTMQNVKITGGADSTPVITLTGNMVFDNVDFDGVTAQYAELIKPSAGSNITVNNCTVQNLDGGDYGMAFVRAASNSNNNIKLDIVDSNFIENNAKYSLIRIHSRYWNVTIKNSNFTNNVGGNGGVMEAMSSYGRFANITVDNCNFTNNRGSRAGVIQSSGNSNNITVINSKGIFHFSDSF